MSGIDISTPDPLIYLLGVVIAAMTAIVVAIINKGGLKVTSIILSMLIVVLAMVGLYIAVEARNDDECDDIDTVVDATLTQVAFSATQTESARLPTETPSPSLTPAPSPVVTWDFEDCTVGGWGVYNGSGGVDPDPGVSIAGDGVMDGNCSLMISQIDTPGSPAGSVQKWPAIVYPGGFSQMTLTADVYVPADADFADADIQFFLFDGDWTWYDNVIPRTLVKGQTVELTWTWSIDAPKAVEPWQEIIGFQVYIKNGTFTGPVYIDNVTLYQ